ncbi:MAG: hypothetical protein ABIA75_10220 [Candidatus Neomarinimicrobiota bacterium]
MKTSNLIMCLILFAVINLPAVTADVDRLLNCSGCLTENQIADKYCRNCGEPLTDEQSDLRRQEQAVANRNERFSVRRVMPPRLFTVPTADVLGSLDISLVGGGAFGVAIGRSFLGTVGIGLGDLAEIEFSTVDLVNNISSGATVFPTSAFKLVLIPEKVRYLPKITVAFRSSSNWQNVYSDESVLKADADLCASGVSQIGYDTRFTTMHAVASQRLRGSGWHAGVSLTDVRVKELAVNYYIEDSVLDPNEKQVNLPGLFFGFDIESNPQTTLMFEAKTVSSYQYNVDTQIIDVINAYMAVGGVRFFFTPWFSTDTGVWYHSSFRGIADLQIKIGVNLFIPTGHMSLRIPAALAERNK